MYILCRSSRVRMTDMMKTVENPNAKTKSSSNHPIIHISLIKSFLSWNLINLSESFSPKLQGNVVFEKRTTGHNVTQRNTLQTHDENNTTKSASKIEKPPCSINENSRKICQSIPRVPEWTRYLASFRRFRVVMGHRNLLVEERKSCMFEGRHIPTFVIAGDMRQEKCNMGVTFCLGVVDGGWWCGVEERRCQGKPPSFVACYSRDSQATVLDSFEVSRGPQNQKNNIFDRVVTALSWPGINKDVSTTMLCDSISSAAACGKTHR